MNTRTIANLALAASLGLGALGVASPSNAADWAEAIGVARKVTGAYQVADHATVWQQRIGVSDKVTGPFQLADRSTDWARAVSGQKAGPGAVQMAARTTY